MTRHLRCGMRIADFVLQRLAWPSDNLQKRPVIPLQKYEKRLTSLKLGRPALVAVFQGLCYGGI
jgi:hypothetical protein